MRSERWALGRANGGLGQLGAAKSTLLAACKTLGLVSPAIASPHRNALAIVLRQRYILRTHCSGCAVPVPFDAPRSMRLKQDAVQRCLPAPPLAPRVQADLQEKRRGGTAQQYHAYKKYKKAVAVAVEKRADDTKRSDVLHLMEVAG